MPVLMKLQKTLDIDIPMVLCRGIEIQLKAQVNVVECIRSHLSYTMFHVS